MRKRKRDRGTEGYGHKAYNRVRWRDRDKLVVMDN